ncbi:MAG: transporter [bacterium]|nr:transporter [bacterium]
MLRQIVIIPKWGASLNAKWGAYVEYYGYYYGDEGEGRHYVNGGFTYLVSKLFQLDIRAGRILNKNDSTFFIGTGGAVRF